MPRLHSGVPFTKQVGIEVLSSSWKAPATTPSALVAAAQSSPASIDVLASLLFLALWTRPPVTYGFSLSDCWAWLRYFPAIAISPDLRLRDEWTTLDPHHKTVLSGDFGVGFTTWFLFRTLGFVRYSDTLWVVNSLLPGTFRLLSSSKRGPAKSPDYIAEDLAGKFSVLECKGAQSNRLSLQQALDRGAVQKANLAAIGPTTLRHSLVAGLFIPQFDNSDSAVLMVADPIWDDIRELLSRFSTETLGRAVTGVSYAKELAILGLPNVANALVRADGSDESLDAALDRDRTWRRREGIELVDEVVRVERDYRWALPTKISEQRSAEGVRFEGTLAVDAVEGLLKSRTPNAVAETKYHQSREHTWRTENGDMAVTLYSPLGSTFRLSILEQ